MQRRLVRVVGFHTHQSSEKGIVLAAKKKELPEALRQNADRLRRGEALHKKKPVPQRPKIRTAKSRKSG